MWVVMTMPGVTGVRHALTSRGLLGADLDDAQPAAAVGPLEAHVVAQRGNLDALVAERLKDGQTALNFDLAVVDRDGDALRFNQSATTSSDCLVSFGWHGSSPRDFQPTPLGGGKVR